MMKSEFDEKLGKKSKYMDWEAIERVYMWHPSFDRTDAKKVTVDLYKLLGVRPFLEMYDTATKAMEIQEEVNRIGAQLETAKTKLKEFNESNR